MDTDHPIKFEGALEVRAQYPRHFEVIDEHTDALKELAKAENKRYGRKEKPLQMSVLFMAAIDVTTATYRDNPVDVRTYSGLFFKSSEILEAAEALNSYYILEDTHAQLGGTLSAKEQQYLDQKSTMAIIEMADTLYNTILIYLTTRPDVGLKLLEPFLVHLDPDYLDLLLQVAIQKYEIRYYENEEKNIDAEDAQILRRLLSQHKGFRLDLSVNRGRFALILRLLRHQYTELAEKLKIKHDENGIDITLTPLILESQLLPIFSNAPDF